MKTKKKIMAIWIVLLLVAIPCSIAEADDTIEGQSNESFLVEIATVAADGIQIAEMFQLSEEELTEFESTMAEIFEKIQYANDLDGVKEIFEKLLGSKHPILGTISKAFLKYKTSKSRAFVMSHGRSYNFNPLQKNQFKIRKNMEFWQYSSTGITKAKTFILRPLALDFDMLSGRQFGLMTKFTGIYIHIAKMFPDQSYTFFMGTARHIRGMDFKYPSINNKIPALRNL